MYQNFPSIALYLMSVVFKPPTSLNLPFKEIIFCFLTKKSTILLMGINLFLFFKFLMRH